MYFKCEFPECLYETENRNLLDFHHIIPKSLGGSDLRFNRLYLCPNCHRRIYIKNEDNGIHSIKTKESIEILGKVNSTVGQVLHFRRCNDDKECFWYFETSELSVID